MLSVVFIFTAANQSKYKSLLLDALAELCKSMVTLFYIYYVGVSNSCRRYCMLHINNF